MSEDFAGWTASHQVSFCKQCDSQEFTDENIEPTAKDDDVVIVKVCKINEKKRKELSAAKQKEMEDPINRKESL